MKVTGDVVRKIVRGELVIFAVEGELAGFDSISKASDGGTEVEGVVCPAFKGTVSESKFGKVSVGIGDLHTDEMSTEFADLDGHTVVIGEGEELDGMSVDFPMDRGGGGWHGSLLGD